MRPGSRPWLPLVCAALAVAAWMVAVLGLIWLTLDDIGRAALLAALPEQGPLLALGWAGGSLGLAWAWQRWAGRPGRSLARLSEHTRSLLEPGVAPALTAADPRLQPLVEHITALVGQRERLRVEMAEQVREASGRVQQEKDRLGALLADLPQSVLVCNLEGRILLYNQRAREQLGTAVGIGRSVHALIDADLLEHALQAVRLRLAAGAAGGPAQFVTYTRDGKLLRVQMTPVLAGAAADEATAPVRAEVTGIVLLLDDVTQSFAEESEREHMLSGLTEGSRASLAAIRAAVEMLGYDDVEAEMRKRFLAVVHEETTRMGERIDELASRAADEVRTRWPLENMLAQDFVAVARRHLQLRSDRAVDISDVQPGLWLRVDSYSLLLALAYLAHRLIDELGVQALELRLQETEARRAHLDLAWSGDAVTSQAVTGWELEPMQTAVERSQMTVRDVVTRHDGDMWFQRERGRRQAFFRFLLPLGEAPEADAGAVRNIIGSRPEFYDFDLFEHRESDRALDERPLAELRYTVFDTETTGLDPSGGDAIIQIGAVRIVNARLLPRDTFDRLVNPGRDIPEAGMAIHGITPAMVAGQPRIDAVLPAFYQFAEDSVLVGHNAAFDMKFLQLLEERTGIAFRQPVLDTLMLSAVAYPNQESHGLEAIAERFGMVVEGRHTALGDAMVTAQIWLRLMSQLQAMGIHTLGEAREAAQQTYYARLHY